MKGLRMAVVAAVVLLALGPAGPLGAANFDDLKVGGPVPDFNLKDWSTMEREHKLSDYKGKVVVLEFGSSSTWSFVAQIKVVEKLEKNYRKKGVEFFTIYTREAEGAWQPADYFEKLQRAKGLRFAYGLQTHVQMRRKVLIDDLQDTTFKAYGSTPNAVLIVDKEGNLAYKAKESKPAEIEKILAKLTAQ